MAAPELEIRLAALDRAGRAEACRARLRALEEELAVAHQDGRPGDETARCRAAEVDRLLAALLAGAEASVPVALVAVGSYGREELCPHSDVEVWLVAPPASRPSQLEPLVEAVLGPLRGALEVRHAIRSPEEALALARHDLTAAGALLDARFVAGERGLAERLGREHGQRLERELGSFLRRLAEDRRDRHARFSDAAFLLEPNLKSGEGGTADLAAARWAARARHRVRALAELVPAGHATARQIAAIEAARRFSLTLRTALHLRARRRVDRLTFDLQEALGPVLTPEEDPIRAVEALMQRQLLHARVAKREIDRLIERCAETPRRPQARPLGGAFVLEDGRVAAPAPGAFARPAEIVRAYRVALDRGVALTGATRDAIAEAVAVGVQGDAAAYAELLALILEPRDAGAPSALEDLHDAGALAALLPELGPTTARVRYDLYHVYPLDRHQLLSVAALKAIARGEREAELPGAAAVLAALADPAPLFVAALLHDVGQPHGPGHAARGAELAQAAARRLGLGAGAQAKVGRLVRDHLLLSRVSQRRDLSDPALIGQVARRVGDEESLRQLYLLSLADLGTVAPGGLSPGKARLLQDLFGRTLAHLRQTPEAAAAERRLRLERRKAEVAELLGERPEALAAWFATVPERYLNGASPARIARELVLSVRREGPLGFAVVDRSRRDWSEVSVCADDAPGLLARIAGVLLAHRIDVLSAGITSRALPGGRSEALDTFACRDRAGRPIADPRRWAAVEEDLARVLAGQRAVDDVIASQKGQQGVAPERIVPRVPTTVEVDDGASDEFTVIEVGTQDRPGVLYHITRTLAALALDIHLAKVTTEAGRALDVFYVREPGGGKLDAERTALVTVRLREALGG